MAKKQNDSPRPAKKEKPQPDGQDDRSAKEARAREAAREAKARADKDDQDTAVIAATIVTTL